MTTTPPPGPRRPAKPAAAEPVNSIRLDTAKLIRFLEERDAESARFEQPLKRGFVRWPFRTTAIAMTVTHPGGSQARFNVACRNLSSGGIGVLHSAYIHTGTACTIELPDTRGEPRALTGAVTRCVHVQGTIHEVGVKFAKAIDPRDFIALDPLSDGFSLETVNPENLRGTVLYIDDSTLDQSMVRHFLRETQIALVPATTLSEAIAKAAAGVDLILCSHHLPGGGGEAVRGLRDAGITQPVLMLTADTSAETRRDLVAARADAFITKPLKQSTLFRAMGEFMMLNSGGGGMSSSLPPDHPNLGMLETFVREVREYATQLEAAAAASDAPRVRSLCLQIRGSAPVMGFDRLAELAHAAERALGPAAVCADAAIPLSTLAAACRRTSARAA